MKMKLKMVFSKPLPGCEDRQSEINATVAMDDLPVDLQDRSKWELGNVCAGLVSNIMKDHPDLNLFNRIKIDCEILP